MPQVVRSCFSIPPDLLSCLRWSHTSQHLVNSFSPALFEQGKYSLPFAGRENGTWRHTRSSWQSKELNHPSPSSRSHKPPLNLESKGSGFCVRYGQEKFFLFRSSSFLSYLFISSFCRARLHTLDKAAELEGIFLQHIILCLPDGLHMELCEWARAAKWILPGAVK